MHLLQQAALSRELIKVHIGHDCNWELNASATYWRLSCFLKLINFVYWLNVQSVDVKSWVAYFTSVCVTVDLCRISANLDSYIQSNSFPCFAASSPAGCPEKLPKSPWPFISHGWWINMHVYICLRVCICIHQTCHAIHWPWSLPIFEIIRVPLHSPRKDSQVLPSQDPNDHLQTELII